MMVALLAAASAWWCVGPAPTRRARRELAPNPSEKSSLPLGRLAGGALPVLGFLLIGGWVGAVVGIAVAPVLAKWVTSLESTADRRLSATIRAQLPAALDLMVAVLEVGQPAAAAFSVTASASPAPLATRLERVAHRLLVVGDERAVWAAMSGDVDLAPLGRAFARSADTGIPVSHIIGGLADDLRRDRRASRRDAARRIAVSTAAPLGMCFLPAFFVVGIVPTIISTFQTFTW